MIATLMRVRKEKVMASKASWAPAKARTSTSKRAQKPALKSKPVRRVLAETWGGKRSFMWCSG